MKGTVARMGVALTASAVLACASRAQSTSEPTRRLAVFEFSECGGAAVVRGAAAAATLREALAADRAVAAEILPVAESLPSIIGAPGRGETMAALSRAGVGVAITGTSIRDGDRTHLFANLIGTAQGVAVEVHVEAASSEPPERMAARLTDAVRAALREHAEDLWAQPEPERPTDTAEGGAQ